MTPATAGIQELLAGLTEKLHFCDMWFGGRLEKDRRSASLIFAAGRGSRMKGFGGNKTLLPLLPGETPLEGTHPILLHILSSLPLGPKAIVVNYQKETVVRATRSLGLTYCEQPKVNGTGGAVLAAGEFLETLENRFVIITMGDVPLVKRSTYLNLVGLLDSHSLVVLGFRPVDKRQYGLLEVDGERVVGITEWKYWRAYPEERQRRLQICNSGIYAARREDLIDYLPILKKRPHRVAKEKSGKVVEVEEFFVTDLVELMHDRGLRVGYMVVKDENEVMGVDDLPSLVKAQSLFKKATASTSGSSAFP